MQNLTNLTKTTTGKIVIGLLGLMLFCCVCTLLGGILNQLGKRETARGVSEETQPIPLSSPTEIPTPAAIATLEPTFTPGPTETPIPPTQVPTPEVTLSPEEQVQKAIETTLSDSNRDVDRVNEVTISGDVINVKWSINDNISDDWVKTGAKIDIKNMLQAISETEANYYIINFEGTFSMIDQLGNTSEETVVWATYEKETVSKINWPLFLHDDVYNIASTSKQHPAFAD